MSTPARPHCRSLPHSSHEARTCTRSASWKDGRNITALDELASTVANTSHDPVVQRRSSFLVQWKGDDTTVQDLRIDIERYIGNSWIEQAKR